VPGAQRRSPRAMLCLWLAPPSGVAPCAEQQATNLAAALPVSSVRFERTLPRYSGACLLPLGYEDVEPPTGLEPATSAIRERRSTC
jgi:hypothetical protein